MPYINPAEIKQVRQIDLLSYLQQRNPDELVKTGADTYATKTHSSLKISNGKWYWWAKGFGGVSALDYLIKVQSMSFLDAVRHLGVSDVFALTNPSPSTCDRKELLLPHHAPDNEAAFEYLAKRGIDLRITENCIKYGLIYASTYKGHTNIVFVGKDSNGISRYAFIRATKGSYKGEAAGSNKRFAFKIGFKDTHTVHVFESAIDALSYATLMLKDGLNWKDVCMLSLGGVPQNKVRDTKGADALPKALEQYLKDNPNTSSVHLHLDSDVAGKNATKAIVLSLGKRGIDAVADLLSSGYKDMNDYLLAKAIKHLQRTDKNPTKERSR